MPDDPTSALLADAEAQKKKAAEEAKRIQDAKDAAGTMYQQGLFGGLKTPPPAEGQTWQEKNSQWIGDESRHVDAASARAQGMADRYQAEQSAAQNRNAPAMDWGQVNADRAQAQQARGDQAWLAQQYRDAIAGKGPSAAQSQLEAGRDASIRQAMAMGASARGGAAAQAAASRNAQVVGNQATMQAAQQAAILRAQEQQAAMQGAAALAAQQRAQDLQAQGLSAAQAQAIAQNELAARGQNDDMTKAYLGAELGATGQAGTLEMGQLQNATGFATGQSQLAAQGAANAQARKDNAFGGLMQAGGTLVGAGLGFMAGGPAGAVGGGVLGNKVASDANAKTEIRPLLSDERAKVSTPLKRTPVLPASPMVARGGVASGAAGALLSDVTGKQKINPLDTQAILDAQASGAFAGGAGTDPGNNPFYEVPRAEAPPTPSGFNSYGDMWAARDEARKETPNLDAAMAAEAAKAPVWNPRQWSGAEPAGAAGGPDGEPPTIAQVTGEAPAQGAKPWGWADGSQGKPDPFAAAFGKGGSLEAGNGGTAAGADQGGGGGSKTAGILSLLAAAGMFGAGLSRYRAMSDRGAKTGIQPLTSDDRGKQDERATGGQSGSNAGSPEIKDFLGKLQPYAYEYKPGVGEPGQKFGVMAQDLQKSEVGSTMVDRDPKSGLLAIDVTQGFGPVLAAEADMHRRIAALESMVASKRKGRR